MLRPAAFALLAAVLPAQTPIDLTSWTAESYQAVSGFPNGAWVVAGGGASVTQSANGQPTIFHGAFGLHNLRVEGRITVTGTDDDYIGFVLGYGAGDTTNPAADYLLLDWKRATQAFNFGAPSCTPGSTADIGLALSRVEGIPTADEFWGHVNLDTPPCSTTNDRVTELQRGATLGSTGWVRNQTYTFRIDYSPNRVVVHVDGVPQIDVSGVFANGSIGFYNFSQGGVVYDAFTSQCIASWSNYGAGFPGTAGVPALGASAAPVLGSTVDIQMTSVAPSPELAVLAFGWQPVDVPTPLGGSLLVDFVLLEALLLPVAPGQGLWTLTVPPDGSLCGTLLYTQFVHFDAGAAQGLAFSRGMQLALGL
jgi:hypothetical protein